MYVAALRIADEFGCAAIGIQYQQGLKDLTPASDLVEGLPKQRRPASGFARQAQIACSIPANRFPISMKSMSALG